MGFLGGFTCLSDDGPANKNLNSVLFIFVSPSCSPIIIFIANKNENNGLSLSKSDLHVKSNNDFEHAEFISSNLAFISSFISNFFTVFLYNSLN